MAVGRAALFNKFFKAWFSFIGGNAISAGFRSEKFALAPGFYRLFRKQKFLSAPFFCGTGTTGLLALSLWKKSDKPALDENSPDYIIKKSDALYDAYYIDQLYEMLIKHKESNDPEILWRLARCIYEKAKLMSSQDPLMQTTVCEAYKYIFRALQCEGGDKLFAVHKWYAILLNAVANYEGTKERIKNAYVVREHLQKALDINPNDATTWHILGVWHFTVASMAWYQMKIAAVVFATPPTSSFDEALTNFLKAEMINPNFYSKNLLMIGKTYFNLGKRELAKEYLQRTVDYITVTQDDIDSHREAQTLLAKEFGDTRG